MVDLKKKPKKMKRHLGPEVSMNDEYREKYPYGTQINLEKDELDKLDMKTKDYSVRDTIKFICSANITDISSSESINREEPCESIRFQITDMEIVPKNMKDKFK